MKALLGVISLLLVLGITALLVKKQLPNPSAESKQPAPQQVQQQVKQQVETLMQQPRVPGEEK